MEKGASEYKGKSLSEINIDPHSEKAEENSDEESVSLEKLHSTATKPNIHGKDFHQLLGS